jgi:LytS/YehU family sensor histidine kinase
LAPATLSAAIPSFVLQHLIENAIRHGVAKRLDAGRVVVTARRLDQTLEISVEDDGVGISTVLDLPKGHGIDNTRARLRALYGGRASLTVSNLPTGGVIARLRVPYRAISPETDDAKA